jgi:hypothetical protein
MPLLQLPVCKYLLRVHPGAACGAVNPGYGHPFWSCPIADTVRQEVESQLCATHIDLATKMPPNRATSARRIVPPNRATPSCHQIDLAGRPSICGRLIGDCFVLSLEWDERAEADNCPSATEVTWQAMEPVNCKQPALMGVQKLTNFQRSIWRL